MSNTTKRVAALRADMNAANIPLKKQALLLGQFKKETGNFAFLSELGNKDYFKKYDITSNPKKAKELGNTTAGDGYKYRGRGFVQLTGKANYAKYSQKVYGDDRLVTNPELLETPAVASKVSLAYINDRAGNFETADDLTKAINPGLFSSGLSKEKRAKYDADIATRRENSEIFEKQFTLEKLDDSFQVDGDWGKNSKERWSAYETVNAEGNKARAAFAQTDPRRVDLPETGGTIPVREYAQETRSQPRTEALNPIRNYAAEDMTQQGMGRARIVEPIRPLERTYDFNTMEDLLMSKGLMPNPLL